MGHRAIAFRWRLAGQRHDRADLLGRDPRRRARARRITQARRSWGRGTRTGKPARPPLAHRLAPHAKLRGRLAHPCAIASHQDHPRAPRQGLRCRSTTPQPLKVATPFRAQIDCSSSTGHGPLHISANRTIGTQTKIPHSSPKAKACRINTSARMNWVMLNRIRGN